MRYLGAAVVIVALASFFGLAMLCAVTIVRLGLWQVGALAIAAGVCVGLLYLEGER